MRSTCGAFLLLVGLAGCQHGGFCLTPSEERAPCEVAQGAPDCHPGESVVHAPRQKVVVEMPPAPAPAPAPAQAAAVAPPVAAQGLPAGLVGVGQGVPPIMMGYPQMLGAQGLGATAPGTMQVRERTGLGFAFDTIRIPFPIIRLIAVPRPTEVTTRMSIPVQQAAGFTGFGAAALPGVPLGFAAGTSFGVPAGLPAGLPMGVPMGAAFGAQSFGVAPPQTLALTQAAAQGQLTPQQVALLQALLAQSASGSGAGAAQSAESNDQQLEELLKKCEELKKLKQLKQQMEKEKAGQMEKVGQSERFEQMEKLPPL
jgi:hypothetical protein